MIRKMLLLGVSLVIGMACSEYSNPSAPSEDVFYPVVLNAMPPAVVTVYDSVENAVVAGALTPTEFTPESEGQFVFVMSVDDSLYDGFAGIFNVFANVQTPPVNVSLARNGTNGKDGQAGQDGKDGQNGVSYIAVCLDAETIVINYDDLTYFIEELGATPGACPIIAAGSDSLEYRVEEFDFTPNKSVGDSPKELVTIQTRSYAVAELGYDVMVRRDLHSSKDGETIRVGHYVGEEQIEWIGDSHRAPCDEILPDVDGFSGDHLMYVGTIYSYNEFETFVAQVASCDVNDETSEHVSVHSVIVGYWTLK